MMEWEAQRIEAGDGFGHERPDPGDGDDRCKHGNVVYGEGDCELCDEEQDAYDDAPLCWLCEQPVPEGTPAVHTNSGNSYHLECIAKVTAMEPAMRARYLASLRAQRGGR